MERQKRWTRSEFEQQIAHYQGNDPLKLHYEFIKWMEEHDKENSREDNVLPLVEEALKLFRSDQRYVQDKRLVHLFIIYVEKQVEADQAKLYEILYNQGIGTSCSEMYKAWAEQLFLNREVAKAEKVFQMGIDAEAQPIDILVQARRNFLINFATQLLSGQETCMSFNLCQNQKQVPPAPLTTVSTDMPKWEYHPLAPGEHDDFTCPLVVPDPDDPYKKPMYRKHEVYVNNTEYSFEEIRNAEYLNRVSKRTASHVVPIRTFPDDESMEAETSREPGFRVPLIHKTPDIPSSVPEDHESSQSFTAYTKAAMNAAREMWRSPTPMSSEIPVTKHTLKTPVSGEHPEKPMSSLCGNNKENILIDSEQKRRTPFPVFIDESMASGNCDKNHEFATPGEPLSSRNLKMSERKALEEATPGSHEPIKPSLGLQPKRPERQPSLFNVPSSFGPEGDTDDITCNTKAFEFVLPSSTPFGGHNKTKPNYDQLEGSYIVSNPEPVTDNKNVPPELSVILEGSKEKYSSSSSASMPKTPKNLVPKKSKGKEKAAELIVPRRTRSKKNIDSQVSEVENSMKGLNVREPELVDPYDPIIIKSMMTAAKLPMAKDNDVYHTINAPLPSIIKTTKSIKLGSDMYLIGTELGKGAYARVVKGESEKTTVALKIEKPTCYWEYYIISEVHKRIIPEMAPGYMSLSSAYMFTTGSVLVSDWAEYGTILDVAVKWRKAMGNNIELPLLLHFTIQLIDIIYYLHKCQIIHGDVKPDNFVVKSLPSRNETLNIQLIDFGRSIDMTLFKPGQKFNGIVNTSGFQCVEMKEKRPWTYQTDLFGLAGTVHCLMFGEYMSVAKKNQRWAINKAIPRYAKKDLWQPFYHNLLNIESCDKLPDLESMKTAFVKEYKSIRPSSINSLMDQFSNVIKGK